MLQRLFRQQVADNGALPVVRRLHADAHLVPHRRPGAIGRHKQLAVERFGPAIAMLYVDGRPFRLQVDVDDPRRAQQRDPTHGVERFFQHLAEDAIYNDITERFYSLFLGVDVRETEATLVGDVNVANRRGCCSDPVPQAHRPEHAMRAARKRGRALVETRLLGGLALDGFDDGYLEPERRQRQRQAGADHAAAGDDDIVTRVHGCPAHNACISASTSAGSLTRPLLSTSGPFDVTATSSSMRTPMLRRAFGTDRLAEI